MFDRDALVILAGIVLTEVGTVRQSEAAGEETHEWTRRASEAAARLGVELDSLCGGDDSPLAHAERALVAEAEGLIEEVFDEAGWSQSERPTLDDRHALNDGHHWEPVRWGAPCAEQCREWIESFGRRGKE